MAGKLSKSMVLILVLAFLALAGMNSFYVLENAEQAVVQRFGEKIAVIEQSGLNFKVPFVDKVTIIKTNEIRSVQYGYRPDNVPTPTSAPTYRDHADEQIVLTKGSYLVNIGAIIQYRITDAADYIYNVDDQIGTLRLAFESVLRRNMQNKDLEDALINKDSIAVEILPDLIQKVNSYGLGITIVEVKFTDVLLPESVQFAYDDVNIAENEKDEFVSKAAKYTNEKLPAARADAYQRIQSAEAYKAEKIAQARGDVENFIQVYEKYKVSKDVTKTRLYIETMENILQKSTQKFILDMDGSGTVKYLPLNPDVMKGDNKMSFGNNNNQNPNNGPNFNDFQQQTKERAEAIAKNAKKAAQRAIVGILVLFLLVGASSFFYIVAEDEVATVRRLGEITKVIVDVNNEDAAKQNALDAQFSDVQIVRDKGLFFKIPFITQVSKNTSKLITYISNSAQINTKDKIKYQISMFAQWEITHPGLFSTSLGSVQRANANIDEVAYAVVIEKVNGLTSKQFLTDKDALYSALDVALVELNEKMAPKGIVLKDIEVYRTILPESNIESTYKKMIAERGAIAQQKRSEGQELFQNTVADTDRKVAEIIAESIETSEKIIGEADATALEIYAGGFSKDPSFYEYWRTLKSYERTIDEDTVIYMDKNNDYLKFFRGN